MSNPSEIFVQNFFQEKQVMLQEFFSKTSQSMVSSKLKECQLTDEQCGQVEEIVDAVLTDAFYSILVGLSGGASIGSSQQEYRIFNENNDQLEDIDAYAWDCFHGE